MRAALTLAMCAAACATDDTGRTHYVAIDQVEQAYHAAACEHLVRCGEFPDQAACESAVIPTSFSFDPTSQTSFSFEPNAVAAVLAGKAVYDGNKLAQCFAAFAATSCDLTDTESRTQPRSCFDTIRGTVAGGGACATSVECVSQNCATPGCAPGACCEGTCVGDTPPIPPAPGEIGKPCTAEGEGSSQCVSGAYCEIGTCTKSKGAGENCVYMGEPPVARPECDSGLACSNTSWTCVPRPTVGQPCPDHVCRDEGTYCAYLSTGLCTPLGLPGAPCNSSMDCSRAYRCDVATLKCIPMPRIGEECKTVGPCFDADAYCDTWSTNLSFVCTPLIDDGMPCTYGIQCKSLTCDTAVTPPVCAEAATCL